MKRMICDDDNFGKPKRIFVDPTPNISEFKNGFKYLAFIGYSWIEVEYPVTGFSKNQLKQAISKNLVKRINQ